jgi:hypothetical protein
MDFLRRMGLAFSSPMLDLTGVRNLMRRIGLSFTSPMLDLSGDRNDLMLDLAVLNQEASFFGVVGSAESMLSGLSD